MSAALPGFCVAAAPTAARLHHGADASRANAMAYSAKVNGSVCGLSSHQRIGPAKTMAQKVQCSRDAAT